VYAVDDAWRKKIQETKDNLHKELYDLYHKIGKTEVWRASNDGVCDMCEDHALKQIDGAIKALLEDWEGVAKGGYLLASGLEGLAPAICTSPPKPFPFLRKEGKR
jgi:hypothetical protein